MTERMPNCHIRKLNLTAKRNENWEANKGLPKRLKKSRPRIDARTHRSRLGAEGTNKGKQTRLKTHRSKVDAITKRSRLKGKQTRRKDKQKQTQRKNCEQSLCLLLEGTNKYVLPPARI